MQITHRLAQAATALGLRAEVTDTPPRPRAPERSKGPDITTDRAIAISTVFSCVSILATAAEQCSLYAERNFQQVTNVFLDQPDRDIERPIWVHQLVTSLALSGNAYLRVYRDSLAQPLSAVILPPNEVFPIREKGRIIYHHNGKEYTSDEIRHLAFLRLPGRLLGIGPLHAARPEIAGLIDLRDTAAAWFRDSGTPAGVLSTEKELTADVASKLMQKWNDVPAGKTRLLTHGLTYDAIRVNPRDAQYVEVRRAVKTEIADVYGVPASLLLGVEAGDSQTYANIEQDWSGFIRFRLMRYLGEIETALTSILPRGQRARFNIDSLLRTDSATRMNIHATAINAGVYGPKHARSIEHLPEDAAL